MNYVRFWLEKEKTNTKTITWTFNFPKSRKQVYLKKG